VSDDLSFLGREKERGERFTGDGILLYIYLFIIYLYLFKYLYTHVNEISHIFGFGLKMKEGKNKLM